MRARIVYTLDSRKHRLANKETRSQLYDFDFRFQIGGLSVSLEQNMEAMK